MSGIWAAYNKALAAQPLLVKAMTSFTGFTVGDILAQKFISPEDDYDFMRTLRLGTSVVLLRGSADQSLRTPCSSVGCAAAAALPALRPPIHCMRLMRLPSLLQKRPCGTIDYNLWAPAHIVLSTSPPSRASTTTGIGRASHTNGGL